MWWSELTAYGQACFVIGCVTGLFMIIQIVLMAIGMSSGDDYSDTGSDVDADIYNDGFTAGLKILSVRTTLAFLCVGSWLVYTLLFHMPWWGATLIGIAGGFAMALIVAVAIRAFERLQSEGNIIIENCIGKTGSVYLTVPANRAGQGKVNVCVQEKLTEFEAITDSQTPIKTGSQIKVTSIASEGVLVVESIS